MMIYHSESQLERKLFERVKKMGGMCLKFVSPGRAGVPDRIILMPNGKIYFVEMKSLAGQTSIIQDYVFKKFSSRDLQRPITEEIFLKLFLKNFFCRNRREQES